VEQIESRVKNLESRRKQSRLSTLATSDSQIVNLSKIQKTDYKRISTSMEEFDRVLGGPARQSPDGSSRMAGGGIVPGSLILVSGDPGIGKSTLLTQLALNINKPLAVSDSLLAAKSEQRKANSSSVLYVAGEESAQQIKIRVDRINPKASFSILSDTDVDNIIEAIGAAKPTLVIVDSIQTLQTQDLESIAGSVGQVRECAHRLQLIAKSLQIPIFLVGHVTKEGNLAGPKTLEHVVDVVLSLEGDPQNQFRILRSTKNRFGPTDEVGVFEMEEGGMIEVKNPSKLFLESASRRMEAPGSAVAATMNGTRPLLVEIQALVTKSFLPMPRRTGSGIDNNRLQLLVAVLQSRMKLPLFDKDIFVNVTGGLRVIEPAADLAICLAIASSLNDAPISSKTVLIGEVGLLGELRPVRFLDKRTSEAKKLGFTKVISSENAKSLSEAVKLVLGK